MMASCLGRRSEARQLRLEETPDLGIMVRDENGKILFEVNAFVWTQELPNPPHLN